MDTREGTQHNLWQTRLRDPAWKRGVDPDDPTQVTLWVRKEDYTDGYEDILHTAGVEAGHKDIKNPKDDQMKAMVERLRDGPPGAGMDGSVFDAETSSSMGSMFRAASVLDLPSGNDPKFSAKNFMVDEGRST